MNNAELLDIVPKILDHADRPAAMFVCKKWLKTYRKLRHMVIFYLSDFANSKELIKWSTENGCECKNLQSYYAAKSGNMDALIYLNQNGYELDSICYAGAVTPLLL